MATNLKNQSPRQLLSLYVQVLQELRRQEITRSTNNPVADYAELLFERGLGLTRTPKSTKGHDAVGPDGKRYEVTARRLTAHNTSRQLSALRSLDDKHFDCLAGVLFDENFAVRKACLVPHDQVVAHAKYRKHTNSLTFYLRDDVWTYPGVVDVTRELAAAEL